MKYVRNEANWETFWVLIKLNIDHGEYASQSVGISAESVYKYKTWSLGQYHRTIERYITIELMIKI